MISPSENYAIRAADEHPVRSVQQPLVIKFGGHVYRRFKKYYVISKLVSQGPFYSRKDINRKDWAFTPDLSFLLGNTNTVLFMHCIQQCAAPKSPHPSTLSD